MSQTFYFSESPIVARGSGSLDTYMRLVVATKLGDIPIDVASLPSSVRCGGFYTKNEPSLKSVIACGCEGFCAAPPGGRETYRRGGRKVTRHAPATMRHTYRPSANTQEASSSCSILLDAILRDDYQSTEHFQQLIQG